MKVSQKAVDLMNRQIGNEFSSMIQYFAIANRFDRETLPELNAHFSNLAERKKENALRYMDQATGKENSLTIPMIPAPRVKFASTEEAVKFSLEKEIEEIERVNAIMRAVKEDSDQATRQFVEELSAEQEEEVLLMRELLGTVQKAGENNLLLVEDFLIRKTSVAVEV